MSDIWNGELSGASESDALSVIEAMMNGIGGGIVGMETGENAGSESERGVKPLRGVVGSFLLQECSTLLIRDHYDYSKMVVCSLVSILNSTTSRVSDDIGKRIGDEYLPQVCLFCSYLKIELIFLSGCVLYDTLLACSMDASRSHE